jgi:hypothetical protein
MPSVLPERSTQDVDYEQAYDILGDLGSLCDPARHPLVTNSSGAPHAVEAAYDKATKPFL